MNPEQTRHGGPGRGQGRKPLKDGEPTVVVSLRMTADQREVLRLMGGSEWVREMIDAIPPKSVAKLRQMLDLKT